MGNGQLDTAEGKVKSSTNVQGMRVFHPLVQKPVLDLEIGDRCRAGALGNGHGIPYMISMAVGYEDIVGLHLLGANVSQGIAGQEGVNQQIRVSDLDAKAGMAVIREPQSRHNSTSQSESW